MALITQLSNMLPIVHVVIDASVLHRNFSFNSASWLAFMRHCRAGTIVCHIPVVAEKEFVGGIEDQIRECSEKIDSTRARMNRLIPNPQTFDYFSFVTEQTYQHDLKTFRERWQQFKKEANIQAIRMQPADTSYSMNAYFKGGAPFQQRRSREDFPDAFIFAAIRRLRRRHSPIIVLVADKRLATACQSLQLLTYPDVPAFLTGDWATNLTSAFSEVLGGDKAARFLLFHQETIQKQLSATIRSFLLNEPDLIELLEYRIMEKFMEESQFDIQVAPASIAIDASTVQEIAPNNFLFHINFPLECQLEYVIERGSLWELGEDRVKAFSSMISGDLKHYKIREVLHRPGEGVASLILPPDIRIDELENQKFAISLESVSPFA